MLMSRLLKYVTIHIAWAALSGCSHDRALSEINRPSPVTSASAVRSGLPEKLLVKHLPNAYRIHPKVISGGLPEGDAAFHELADLGVQTIISVDGMRPDVDTAREHGLRYVHLPHGYDGVPDQRVRELAKAVRDLPGPIYIHCHHGKHRSPAAATVACVSVGFLPPESASNVLRIAGTSENYRGLYQAAESARRMDDRLLDELTVEFRERAELPPMAETMVALESTHEHLKSLAAAEWKPPIEHPDLDPEHEALLLREQFAELLRADSVRKPPPRFQQLVRDSETASAELEQALRDWNRTDRQSPVPVAIGTAFERVSTNCVGCHREFRDVPLNEKTAP